jgi:hypothetical protein
LKSGLEHHQLQLQLNHHHQLQVKNVEIKNAQITEETKPRLEEVKHAINGHHKHHTRMPAIHLPNCQKKALNPINAEIQVKVKPFGAIPPIQRRDGTGVIQWKLNLRKMNHQELLQTHN